MKATLTISGSGTSGGIPLLSCGCDVCTSNNPKDKRLRTSAIIHIGEQVVIIDPGPDFRQQLLSRNVKRVDAILVTHGHRDHIAGLDDIRPFNFSQEKEIPIYCDEICERMIREQFSYVFKDTEYPYLPKINFIRIDNRPFNVFGIQIIPIEVMHHRLAVKGFRIGNLTYITDAKTISEYEIEKVKGTKFLVVNALRKTDHISHFTLEEALHFIEQVKAEKAWLTHISHHMGKHNEVNESLQKNVQLAWDGLEISFDLECDK